MPIISSVLHSNQPIISVISYSLSHDCPRIFSLDQEIGLISKWKIETGHLNPPSQGDQETESESDNEEDSTITIRKLKSNKKMLISKNQRLCGVLDKIDNVIIDGTKMTHTQAGVSTF